MKKKQIIVLAIIVGVIGLAIGGWLIWGKSKKTVDAQPTPTEKKRITEPVNVIEVAKRPYFRIEPLADGRNIRLKVLHLNQPAASVDYELEYQSGSLLQGAYGLLDLATLPVSKEILLGSCSAGGACTYHTDVKGGTILTRFSGEDQNYALKSDWRFWENTSAEKMVSSRDAKFTLESPSIAKQRYLIITNSPGYPSGVEGKVISEIYAFAAPTTLTGEATLTIRANEENSQAEILGYDGQKWQNFSSTVNGKEVTATVSLMDLYLVRVK